MRPDELIVKWKKEAYQLRIDVDNWKLHYEEKSYGKIWFIPPHVQALQEKAITLEYCAEELRLSQEEIV